MTPAAKSVAPAGHTPGPWMFTVNECASDSWRFSHYIDGQTCPAGQGPVADVRNIGPESAANARLIAAAPDMLAALRAVLDIPANEPGRVVCLVPTIRAAIAKAKGGQP